MGITMVVFLIAGFGFLAEHDRWKEAERRSKQRYPYRTVRAIGTSKEGEGKAK